MNRTEVVTLCRMVRAYCPAQAMDEYSPDAWYDVLAGARMEDAIDALKHLARSQRFIAAGDVLGRVRYVRNDRVERGRPDLIPPEWLDELEGDAHTIGYAQWLDGAERDLADGNQPDVATPALTRGTGYAASIKAALPPPPPKRNNDEDAPESADDTPTLPATDADGSNERNDR